MIVFSFCWLGMLQTKASTEKAEMQPPPIVNKNGIDEGPMRAQMASADVYKQRLAQYNAQYDIIMESSEDPQYYGPQALLFILSHWEYVFESVRAHVAVPEFHALALGVVGRIKKMGGPELGTLMEQAFNENLAEGGAIEQLKKLKSIPKDAAFIARGPGFTLTPGDDNPVVSDTHQFM